MGRIPLERWVTAGLVVVLLGVLVWRFDLLGTEPADKAREDPFQILAVWQENGRQQLRSFVLPRAQIAGRAAAGALFQTLETLPETPFGSAGYLVFRYGDEALVTESVQPRAVEDGNRCLMVIAARTVSEMGGPLTAMVTLKRQLPETPLCVDRPG
ncbi:MAG: hypothetical protein AAGC57_10215 [Pseudomonadota bacterium]